MLMLQRLCRIMSSGSPQPLALCMHLTTGLPVLHAVFSGPLHPTLPCRLLLPLPWPRPRSLRICGAGLPHVRGAAGGECFQTAAAAVHASCGRLLGPRMSDM